MTIYSLGDKYQIHCDFMFLIETIDNEVLGGECLNILMESMRDLFRTFVFQSGRMQKFMSRIRAVIISFIVILNVLCLEEDRKAQLLVLRET